MIARFPADATFGKQCSGTVRLRLEVFRLDRRLPHSGLRLCHLLSTKTLFEFFQRCLGYPNSGLRLSLACLYLTAVQRGD